MNYIMGRDFRNRHTRKTDVEQGNQGWEGRARERGESRREPMLAPLTIPCMWETPSIHLPF